MTRVPRMGPIVHLLAVSLAIGVSSPIVLAILAFFVLPNGHDEGVTVVVAGELLGAPVVFLLCFAAGVMLRELERRGHGVSHRGVVVAGGIAGGAVLPLLLNVGWETVVIGCLMGIGCAGALIWSRVVGAPQASRV